MLGGSHGAIDAVASTTLLALAIACSVYRYCWISGSSNGRGFFPARGVSPVSPPTRSWPRLPVAILVIEPLLRFFVRLTSALDFVAITAAATNSQHHQLLSQARSTCIQSVEESVASECHRSKASGHGIRVEICRQQCRGAKRTPAVR